MTAGAKLKEQNASISSYGRNLANQVKVGYIIYPHNLRSQVKISSSIDIPMNQHSIACSIN